MSALRNTIITLIILGVGIFLIQRLGEGFLKSPGLPTEVNAFGDLIASAHNLADIIIIGIGALVVLLVIIWIVRKIQTRRASRLPAMPTIPELPEEIPEEETAELQEEREEER